MFYRIYISFLILVLEYKLITNHTSNNFNVKIRRTITNIKRTGSRVTYYSNSTATFNAIIKLKFDIETNPGPTIAAPKCPVCEKTTRINQNRLIYTIIEHLPNGPAQLVYQPLSHFIIAETLLTLTK